LMRWCAERPAPMIKMCFFVAMIIGSESIINIENY